jgi:hypothetical protein
MGYFAWTISWATLELGPTGSTNRICWVLRYMRSGSCNSLPRLIKGGSMPGQSPSPSPNPMPPMSHPRPHP